VRPCASIGNGRQVPGVGGKIPRALDLEGEKWQEVFAIFLDQGE
jgi:hypothetical protein